jgi:hypothetical protein
MAVETVTPEHVHEHVHAQQWEETTLSTELLIALGVVILSIIAIVGVLRTQLAAISVIGIGAMLLFQGAAIALHYSELLYEADSTREADAIAGSQGIATEFLVGTAGIVLGVLALIGIASSTLMSVAAIGFGSAMLVTSTELTCNALVGRQSDAMRYVIRQVGSAAAGAQVLVGLAGIVLGILALVGMTSTMMILVALLAMGALILVRSSAVSGISAQVARTGKSNGNGRARQRSARGRVFFRVPLLARRTRSRCVLLLVLGRPLAEKPGPILSNRLLGIHPPLAR